jgi:hypothetical protein
LLGEGAGVDPDFAAEGDCGERLTAGGASSFLPHPLLVAARNPAQNKIVMVFTPKTPSGRG